MHTRLKLHLTYLWHLRGYWVTSGLPGVKTSIQDMHVGMTEVFQEPETACRAHPSDALVEDDCFVQIHPALLEQVLDHPHERRQRFWTSIVQREPKEIEVHRARYPPLRIGGCGAYIDERQVGITESAVELLWRPEQARVGIPFGSHTITSLLAAIIAVRLQPAKFFQGMLWHCGLHMLASTLVDIYVAYHVYIVIHP